MSLFGKVETPRAERPGPAVKPLTELSLRVYGARLEPEQNVVRLHAEAKTAFADGTTGAGVSVGFFLNGRRLSDIVSDDYGLALFDDEVPAGQFHEGDNELVLRVKGFARVIAQTFVVDRPQPKPSKYTFQRLETETHDAPAINAEAQRLIEQEHDYEQAVEILERLHSGLRNAGLYPRAVQLRDLVRDLDQQLAEAQKDGTPEELRLIATLLAELLPNNEGLSRLIATLPKPQQLPQALTNAIGMQLVLIPPGQFEMGEGNKLHRVLISRSFYMGFFPVTQAEYQFVTGRNPSSFCATGLCKEIVQGKDTSRFPVERVPWHEARHFCRKLTKLCEKDNSRCSYRLPTEAEWEYACRAGTKTAYAFGDSLCKSDANIDMSVGHPSTVGSYRPNAFGLYDMHGNVDEWCEDVYVEAAASLLLDPARPDHAADAFAVKREFNRLPAELAYRHWYLLALLLSNLAPEIARETFRAGVAGDFRAREQNRVEVIELLWRLHARQVQSLVELVQDEFPWLQ